GRGARAGGARRQGGVRVEGDDVGRARGEGRARHQGGARRLLRHGHRGEEGAKRGSDGRDAGGSMSARKTFAVYAVTRHGVDIARRLIPAPQPSALYVSETHLAGAPPGSRPLSLPMGPTLADTFAAYDCHVFVISVGAVVRMIAPLLKNKKVDPAVVCVDDAARFAICVLSGHVGRGNVFTDRVASVLGAQSVVTTASDAIGT